MLVPMTCSMATTAGMTFVTTRPFTPKTDTLVVTRILTTRQTPCSLEFALPASVKALTPVGVLISKEALLTDANGPISFVVIRHHHFGASPERGRMMDCPPSSCNPVYERLYHSCVSSSTHLESPFISLVCFCFPVAFHYRHLYNSKHRANIGIFMENKNPHVSCVTFTVISSRQESFRYCLQ